MVCDLFLCAVCDGFEGSLLPFCPGRKLTPEQHETHYADYCNGTGLFACTVCDQGYTHNRQHWDAMVAGYHAFDAPKPCAVCGMGRKQNEQHLAACPDDCGAHDYMEKLPNG